MIRRPKARCSRPERALPPGPSAPAQLTSPADGPGPASLPTEAVCLDREPPQGPPARAGGARVRVIALLDQSPATPGHLIESERAESRARAPAREQRVPGARAPTALDASNQPITVCSHHLPRRIERCVSVTSTGGWGSADYASMHVDEARSISSRFLLPAGNAYLARAAIREPDGDRECASARSDAPRDVDHDLCRSCGHAMARSRS